MKLLFQRELPVFFRAYFFVPGLFVLWVAAGCLFPFSPHQLTHTLPDFLLGADDWGVGNIYAYTKLADWIGLLAGCVACTHVGVPATTPGEEFAKRLRLCLPHLMAAAALHFVPVAFELGCHSALATDNILLFLWFLAGFGVVASLQSWAETMRRRWPLILSWLVTFGWLFVSVARSRP